MKLCFTMGRKVHLLVFIVEYLFGTAWTSLATLATCEAINQIVPSMMEVIDQDKQCHLILLLAVLISV